MNNIITEGKRKPKVIITAGSTASGKSQIVKNMRHVIGDMPIINPDKYVESDSTTVAKSLSIVELIALPEMVKSGRDFIYDSS